MVLSALLTASAHAQVDPAPAVRRCSERTGIAVPERFEPPSLGRVFQQIVALRSLPAPEPESSEMLKSWKGSAKTFESNGRRLRYWVAGEGEPLVLVHGFPTASFDWSRVWSALSAKYKVMALDGLGSGFSDKPEDADYTQGAHADRLSAWLVAQGVEETRVLAHDLGDSVVQELLARQAEGRLPFAIRSVVLLNGGLFPERYVATPDQHLLLSPIGSLAACLINGNVFLRLFPSLLGEAARADTALSADSWALLNENDGMRIFIAQLGYIEERRVLRERWVDALVSTKSPLLFINGSADPISGRPMALRFAELLPAAEVVHLPAIGHYPHLEAPAEVAGAALEFFSRH